MRLLKLRLTVTVAAVAVMFLLAPSAEAGPLRFAGRNVVKAARTVVRPLKVLRVLKPHRVRSACTSCN